jgi:tetratricopeptide (TPR) repeat protein
MARFFTLICLSLLICRVKAEQELSAAKDGARLANELSQKLNALGSFQATYNAVSRDRPVGKIRILFDDNQKYCLLEMGETNEQDVFFILDYSQLNEKSGNVEMLTIYGTEGKRCQFSLKQMIEHLDNPVGILCFVGRQIQPDSTNGADVDSIFISHPTLSLGLDTTNIVGGAGFLSGGTNLAVSWFDPNTITNALNIVETSESIQFSYPDNHVVSVDRQTGLLLKDSMPNPVTHNLREIVLEKYTAVEVPMPYVFLVPGFSKVKFEELPPTAFYNQVAGSYLTQVGQQLATNSNFDEILRTNSAKITVAVREATREMVRADVEARVTQESAIKFRNKYLIPTYKDYLQNPPVDIKDLSFTNLLALATSMAETNASLLVPPEAWALIEKKKEDFPNIINTLPKDIQKPFFKIYNIVAPALAEGYVLEYWTATIGQIKTLNFPDLSADEAKAYVKRGLAEQKRGDLADAIYDFRKAMELKPRDASIKKKFNKAIAQMNGEVTPR